MSIADSAGIAPAHNTQTVLLSALVQAPAGTVADLGEQFVETDFTPAGWAIFTEILRHAQGAAKADGNAEMNLPVIHAALTAQGAFHGQDNGTRALIQNIATTSADPLWLPELVAAVKQQAYRRALAAYQDTVTEIDAQTIGITDADQLLNAALKRLRAARQRLETTTPTTKAGIHIAAA